MFDLYTCKKCINKKPNENQSAQNNLNQLMAEYKIGEEIEGKYFSYMYSCINYTFLFYGAAIVVFYNLFNTPNNEKNSMVYFAIFYYLLPISTYIFGLFYAYNAVVICRQGYYMIKIENDIIKLNNEMNFSYPLHGWDRLSKTLPSGYILPYGTMLMFYLGIPTAFYIWGNKFVTFDFISTPIISFTLVKIIPLLCLIIYFIFMIYLICCMFKIKGMYKKELK